MIEQAQLQNKGKDSPSVSQGHDMLSVGQAGSDEQMAQTGARKAAASARPPGAIQCAICGEVEWHIIHRDYYYGRKLPGERTGHEFVPKGGDADARMGDPVASGGAQGGGSVRSEPLPQCSCGHAKSEHWEDLVDAVDPNGPCHKCGCREFAEDPSGESLDRRIRDVQHELGEAFATPGWEWP